MMNDMQTNITLPYQWHPRSYQKNLWRYLENGGKRAYAIWHRRAGKDDLCLHWTATAVMERVGNYWHMLPEAAQARKAIWDAINPKTGKRRIDEAFPHVIRKRTVDNEMKIEFISGSIWQVLGSDNYNGYVGSPPVGVVLSEWALADPASWAYLMPILEENDGWAFFITTPRGRNHAAAFYKMASKAENWFCEKLPASQTDVYSAEQLQRIQAELRAQYGDDEGSSKYDQEYECSFDAALPGSYYGKEMNRAENEERITDVPYSSAHPVFPVFDLGHGDSTAISFVQLVGCQPRIIDYHESSGQSIATYAKLLQDTPYVIPHIILPHDAADGRLGTGKSYETQFKQFGLQTKVLKRTANVNADINLTRNLINQSWFDHDRTDRLIEALRHYHREWDNRNKIFQPHPKHDWSSHGADSFRYAAVAYENGLFKVHKRPDTSLQLPPGQMGL